MIDCLEPNFSDLPGRRRASRIYVKSNSDCGPVDVSIITPYYNTEEVVFETYVSLQAQSLQNWQWIIVDDGSTDKASVERLSRLAGTDSRIRVFRQKNAGPGAARNYAFRNACGRYICMLDSDDMLEPTYLEKCIWFLDSNAEFAFCNSYSVIFGDREYLWMKGFEQGKAHLNANSGPPISVIRREAYKDCGGFDECILFGHEDWDFWLAMAKAGHWGYTIPEFLQWYRKRSSGRFEQIMRSGKTNKEFERQMLRKYEGLDRHFPAPSRRYAESYETIETSCAVSNSLAANPAGRRVMFLLPWMVTGGADRVNLDLIEGLIAKGHDVTICATLMADHRWEPQFSRLTPDIFVLPDFLHASDYPRFLVYLIGSRKIDTVVITGSTIGYHLLPYLRAVSPGVAFVDLCHVEEPHWLNGGHPRFGVGYQDVLELNIVTSAHVARWMEKRGAEAARIRVLHSGVRTSATDRPEAVRQLVRKELNIPEDVPVVVFAGRFCEQKRPELLVEIIKAVQHRGLVFKALIIGDGELKTKLLDLLLKYQLNDFVQVLAPVSHAKWLDILLASDIFLMPSRYEGISIALLESIASGVVPVVSEVGGQDEIVTPNTGILIKCGDNELQDYSDAICRLLTDSKELKRRSKECKTLGTIQLSWERMIDKLISLLDEAHQLKKMHPRNPISPGFGLELASLGLEYKRLGEAVDWLWHSNPNSTTSLPRPSILSLWAQVFSRYAISLSQTRFGKAMLRIHFLKKISIMLLNAIQNASTSQAKLHETQKSRLNSQLC